MYKRKTKSVNNVDLLTHSSDIYIRNYEAAVSQIINFLISIIQTVDNIYYKLRLFADTTETFVHI